MTRRTVPCGLIEGRTCVALHAVVKRMYSCERKCFCVLECGVLPVHGVVAFTAILGEARKQVWWFGCVLEIIKVAAIAGANCVGFLCVQRCD